MEETKETSDKDEMLRWDRPIPMRYIRQPRFVFLKVLMLFAIAISLGLLSGNLIRENIL